MTPWVKLAPKIRKSPSVLSYKFRDRGSGGANINYETMAPSEECEPLLTDHKDVDAIEQGLGISPSNNHRPPVWTRRLVPIVAIIVFLCAVLSYGIGGLPRSNEPRTSGEARMPSDAYGE